MTDRLLDLLDPEDLAKSARTLGWVAGELVGIAPAPHRRARVHPRDEIGIGEQRLVHVGAKVAGRHRVDADARGRELDPVKQNESPASGPC